MSDPATLARRHYIGGRWVESATPAWQDIVNPATDAVIGQVALGSAADVDAAVAAARQAFAAHAATTREQRLALLRRIVEVYERRAPEIAAALTLEMGAPVTLARGPHVGLGASTTRQTIATLEHFAFEQPRGTTRLVHEPIGVCGLITAWNYPMFLIALKVMPALAAGCTVVLKPSEQAPLNAAILAQVMHEAGVPPGVFNLVQGGAATGSAIAAHPDVDMVSFTGSTRGGIAVARAAAATVKRVVQELGGKSANILLPDADFDAAVRKGLNHCFGNSGQVCVAPTRLLVPQGRHDEVKAIAGSHAATFVVGDPQDAATTMGPVANRAQFDKVQALIQSGIDEGAELVVGGPGRPPGISRGCFVRPTVFAGVHNRMRIAQEEIFGPVLSIIPYRDETEAVAIANDSPYGLAAYVQGEDHARACRVAARLRVGTVAINEPKNDPTAPIGGYKQSGNGREKAEFGLMEYLETKALVGWD